MLMFLKQLGEWQTVQTMVRHHTLWHLPLGYYGNYWNKQIWHLQIMSIKAYLRSIPVFSALSSLPRNKAYTKSLFFINKMPGSSTSIILPFFFFFLLSFHLDLTFILVAPDILVADYVLIFFFRDHKARCFKCKPGTWPGRWFKCNVKPYFLWKQMSSAIILNGNLRFTNSKQRKNRHKSWFYLIYLNIYHSLSNPIEKAFRIPLVFWWTIGIPPDSTGPLKRPVEFRKKLFQFYWKLGGIPMSTFPLTMKFGCFIPLPLEYKWLLHSIETEERQSNGILVTTFQCQWHFDDTVDSRYLEFAYLE